MDPTPESGKPRLPDNPESEVDLDYEELPEGGEEEPVNPQIDPQGGEDPLEIGTEPMGAGKLQGKEKEGVDEYEVKVHALEDMEEGEVTSDEEGEIKESEESETEKLKTTGTTSQSGKGDGASPAVRQNTGKQEDEKNRHLESGGRRRREKEGSDSESEAEGARKKDREESSEGDRKKKERPSSRRRRDRSSSESDSDAGSSDGRRRSSRRRRRESRYSSSRSRSPSRSGRHSSPYSRERYRRRSRERGERSEADKIPTVCRHFLNGKCSWGSDCRFMHEQAPKHGRGESPYPRGPLPPVLPPRGSPMHDMFPPGFHPAMHREGPPHNFMPGPLPPHMLPPGGRMHPRDMGMPPLHDTAFLPPPFPPMGTSNVAEVAEESDGWFRLRTVTTEWDSDEEADKKAVEEKLKLSARDSSDSDGHTKSRGRERSKKKRKSDSSPDNSDADSDGKVKKTKSRHKDGDSPTPTRASASSRKKKHSSPDGSSAEDRQGRATKKEKKSSRSKKKRQHSRSSNESPEAGDSSDWSFGRRHKVKKRHLSSPGEASVKKKSSRKGYEDGDGSRMKSRSKRAWSLESSSEEEPHHFNRYGDSFYPSPHAFPPYPPFPPHHPPLGEHPGDRWSHRGHPPPPHPMDSPMGLPFTPPLPPPHVPPHDVRDQFGRDISKRIEYEEMKYRKRSSPEPIPSRDRRSRPGYDSDRRGGGSGSLPQSYERRYSSSNDRSRSITPGASDSSEWEESDLKKQKSRKKKSGQSSLTRKEKLMLELQSIDQKLSARSQSSSQSRKNKLLSELKAIDKAIEKKTKKLNQQ